MKKLQNIVKEIKVSNLIINSYIDTMKKNNDEGNGGLGYLYAIQTNKTPLENNNSIKITTQSRYNINIPKSNYSVLERRSHEINANKSIYENIKEVNDFLKDGEALVSVQFKPAQSDIYTKEMNNFCLQGRLYKLYPEKTL